MCSPWFGTTNGASITRYAGKLGSHSMFRSRFLFLLYALLSAAFYSGLMPLWQGFDVLYHYGYVQHLTTALTLPRIGETPLSRELWNSLDWTPLSHYVQPHVGRPSTSFQEYFQ